MSGRGKGGKGLGKGGAKRHRKSYVITSKVSPNQPSVDWREEVESNVSPVSSTKKLVEFSKSS